MTKTNAVNLLSFKHSVKEISLKIMKKCNIFVLCIFCMYSILPFRDNLVLEGKNIVIFRQK